jgi:hypothetical protein
VSVRNGSQLAFAPSQLLDDDSLIFPGDVDDQLFDRLHNVSVRVPVRDDLGAGDAELEPLPAHFLDQNGQMKLSPSHHLHAVGASEILHAQGHVRAQLPLLDLERLERLVHNSRPLLKRLQTAQGVG